MISLTQLPPVPPPPEELRNSRRNLAKLEQSPPNRHHQMASSAEALLTATANTVAAAAATPPNTIVDKRLAMFKHQPSSPDVLLGKLERIKLEETKNHAPHLSEKSRSYSTGKIHHLQGKLLKIIFGLLSNTSDHALACLLDAGPSMMLTLSPELLEHLTMTSTLLRKPSLDTK